MPFISKDNVEFYGSLQKKNEDLEVINYSLLEQVKPLAEENKALYRDNLGLSMMNEQIKMEKLMLGVVIEKIGNEFKITKSSLVKIIHEVEADYEKQTILLSENKILREISEREKEQNTYDKLKNQGYRSKSNERSIEHKR